MAKACLINCLVLLFLADLFAASNIFRNNFHPIYEVNEGETNTTSFVQPRDVDVTVQDDHAYPPVKGEPRSTALLSITSASNCYQDIHTIYSGKDIYTYSRRKTFCSYEFSNPESRLIEITCSTKKATWCGWWYVHFFYNGFRIDGQSFWERKSDTFKISTTSSKFYFSFFHATSCFRLNCVFSPPATATTTAATTTTTTTTTTTSATTTTTTSSTTTTSTTSSTATTTTTTATSRDCQCGKVNRASRIVNGVETEQNEYPFQTFVLMTDSLGRSFQCGGSIIYQEWILTAAHCTDGYSASQVKVAVGIHDVNKINNYLEVESVHNHQNYDSSTYENDIALLKLKTPLTFSDTISPICLPKSSSENYDGLTPTVIGWGTTSSGGSSSNVLLEVDVPVVSNSVCSNSYSSITNAKLCAGVEGKDSCQGDSGGPLFTDQIQTPCLQQIGVVSYGRGCAAKDYPGVYARVSYFLQWISSITGK